jgi:putative restriction endonuclease
LNFYVGNTDLTWYRNLRNLPETPEDINFWRPSKVEFKAIPVGAPFLLRLKSPIQMIGGMGTFMGYERVLLREAWELFGEGNGYYQFAPFKETIQSYRHKMKLPADSNPEIGAIILNDVVFFHEDDYVPSPSDWSTNIVSGKTYSDQTDIGQALWRACRNVQGVIRGHAQGGGYVSSPSGIVLREPGTGYGWGQPSKNRIGQVAFRQAVAAAYDHTCAITGEKVAVTLEAAHIRDYAELGPHGVANGILMRADLHRLFDNGYFTVTKEFKILVSSQLQERFPASAVYLALDGQALRVLPKTEHDRPNPAYLEWHFLNRFIQ